MADVSEEKSSTTHDITSAKTSLFDCLNKLKKWREEEFAQYQKKQLFESEKSLQLPRESQKQLEQLVENGMRHKPPDLEDKPKEIVPEISDVSSISLPNDLDNCDTLQESSITGHLQRCFNDSTQSNVSVSGNKVLHAPEKVPVFSELRNPQFSEKNPEEKDNPLAKSGMTNDTTKPKRPFLKKGSGLKRYMPKPTNSGKKSRNRESPKVKETYLPQKTLKLKPALRKTDASSEQVKHIRFDIVDSNDNEDIEAETNNDLPSISKVNEDAPHSHIHEMNRPEPSYSAAYTISPESRKIGASNSGSESLNLSRESKELEEFEMLENCAQNSSFNSDSSIVQRMLQGESVKPVYATENYSRMPSQNVISTRKATTVKSPENLDCFEKLNKCNEEVQTRKQMIEKTISDINPRIESLEKIISCDKKQTQSDSDISDRCSTPMNLEDKNLTSECDSNSGSSVFEASPEVKTNQFIDGDNEAVSLSECTCCNINNSHKNFYPVQDHISNCSDKEECTSSYMDEAGEDNLDLNEKSKIHSKVLELQNEIKTYQQLNARASSLCKERDDIVRKLKKKQDDFDKYKETELKKLTARIQEEQRQIKRQKETFTRYQKLSKDNPTKKERDELNSLRSEIEKLHEDLKKQKIKYNRDSRSWKTRLDNAEKERDNFKLENIKLEAQCEDLIASLKIRMKKNSKTSDDDWELIHKSENIKQIIEKKDAESQTEAKDLGFNGFQDSNQSRSESANVEKSKSKDNFGLFSEFEKRDVGIMDKDLDDCAKDPKKDYFQPEQNDLINRLDEMNVEKAATVNLSVISVSGESDFKEIDNGNMLERVYASGEREIIYKSGTRKIISADGKFRKFFFYNGDIKEIFSDGREIYTYVNGVIETAFPDGLKITEFPNGQIQRRHPNGQKEVRFSDGTVHNFLSDGSEEIRTTDGNLIKNCTDGTKIIELANGQREIITSKYKRREFPDGSVKIIYNSGRQETRYSNGRIKIKDKEGKVLFDTKYIST